MYPTIYKTILLPGIDIYLNTAVKRLWNFYEESQWWSLDELRIWQDQRLAGLIVRPGRPPTNADYAMFAWRFACLGESVLHPCKASSAVAQLPQVCGPFG